MVTFIPEHKIHYVSVAGTLHLTLLALAAARTSLIALERKKHNSEDIGNLPGAEGRTTYPYFPFSTIRAALGGLPTVHHDKARWPGDCFVFNLRPEQSCGIRLWS